MMKYMDSSTPFANVEWD